MYADQSTGGHRRRGFAIGTLVSLAASLLPDCSEAGDVGIAIHLDETVVELIRGMRRADGIDPPDAAADQRLRITLERLRARQPDAMHVAAPRVVPVRFRAPLMEA